MDDFWRRQSRSAERKWRSSSQWAVGSGQLAFFKKLGTRAWLFDEGLESCLVEIGLEMEGARGYDGWLNLAYKTLVFSPCTSFNLFFHVAPRSASVRWTHNCKIRIPCPKGDGFLRLHRPHQKHGNIVLRIIGFVLLCIWSIGVENGFQCWCW